MLIDSGRNIVYGSADSKFRHRVEMVMLMLRGMPVDDLVRYSEDSRRSLFSWKNKVLKSPDGWDSLKSHYYGRKPSLNDDERDEIMDMICSSPTNHGFKDWTDDSVMKLIHDTYGISVSESFCHKLIKEVDKMLQVNRRVPQKKK